jgi:hypothetical protein
MYSKGYWGIRFIFYSFCRMNEGEIRIGRYCFQHSPDSSFLCKPVIFTLPDTWLGGKRFTCCSRLNQLIYRKVLCERCLQNEVAVIPKNGIPLFL